MAPRCFAHSALRPQCSRRRTAVRADDTEIYVGQAGDNPLAGRANILFIIDNSGSMDARGADPGALGSGRAFQWLLSTAMRSTSAPAPSHRPCDSEAFIEKTANRCAASRPALASLGQYTGFALGWDEDQERWEPLVRG